MFANIFLLWTTWANIKSSMSLTCIPEMMSELVPIDPRDMRRTMSGLNEHGKDESENDARFTALLYNLHIKKGEIEILSSPHIGLDNKMKTINKSISKIKGTDIRTGLMDDWNFDI